ncbi:HoxN/HupN/NixA family nickel/cobalt transporter [bacterium]|nr:HoxN/HupN/NixA family nickel/cobalt transporter [bacterium]
MLNRIFSDASPRLKRKIALVMGFLIAFNILAWAWAFVAFAQHPLLLGTALLAYSFGLRHAVDADHIAAVDNITRKLMQEGKRPVAVGLFFSLGHSSIVVLMSLVVAITAHMLQGSGFESWRAVGGVASTMISAFFLFTLAGANLVILINTWRSFQRVKAGGALHEDDLDMLMSGGGLMARIFRRLFRLIERDWHIYLLGLLFGLGFDTATEVSLLGMSAAGVANGMSPWSIMVFPTLFCAGMALIDTSDGILMLGAYGWAFQKPIRKLYYNLTITALSVGVAVLVGGIETLGLLQDKLGLAGTFWDGVGALNDNFGLLGYGIVGLFLLGWAASLALYKLRGYDEI